MALIGRPSGSLSPDDISLISLTASYPPRMTFLIISHCLLSAADDISHCLSPLASECLSPLPPPSLRAPQHSVCDRDALVCIRRLPPAAAAGGK